MSLTQFYTATTLDGFIAAPDDSLDWLFVREQDHDGPLNYYGFVANVGAGAMGATTYEWILERHSEEWPYDFPCWVFTHRDLPTRPDVQLVSGDVAPVHHQLVEAAARKNVWIVGGGDLVGQFADVGLLDEVIVFIACVTLGAGKPLLPRRLELRLEETARSVDFVVARYSVPR
jgi:dihydrofolate reductase